MIPNNENKEICAKCGGQCCKNCGCGFSTKDFKGEITKEKILRLLETGAVSVDWWEGDPREDLAPHLEDYYIPKYADKEKTSRGYFLRIKNIKANTYDPAFFGTCILLKEDGCPIDFEHRPYQGKALIPKDDNMFLGGFFITCDSDYSKQECALEWFQYYDILDQLKYECEDSYELKDNAVEIIISILEEK